MKSEHLLAASYSLNASNDMSCCMCRPKHKIQNYTIISLMFVALASFCSEQK